MVTESVPVNYHDGEPVPPNISPKPKFIRLNPLYLVLSWLLIPRTYLDLATRLIPVIETFGVISVYLSFRQTYIGKASQEIIIVILKAAS